MADDVFSTDETHIDGATSPADEVPTGIPTPAPEPKPNGDYEVGYRKPPKHTRFKPGQSGNPKGRRKGAKNTATIARDLLNEYILVKLKGGVRNQPMREVLLRTVMKKAAEKGDIKAFELLLKLSGEPISSASASGSGSGSSDEARFEPSSAEREMLAFHYREVMVGEGLEPGTIERLLSAMQIAPSDRPAEEDG